MLAASGPIRGDEQGWAFEPKWDGWRVLVTIADGSIAVRTRGGRDVTKSVPEIAALGRVVDQRSVVLDGELVAHHGTPASFYTLGGRMAAKRAVAGALKSRTVPLTFVAFDVLWLDGDLTREPYTRRRGALEGLGLVGSGWCTSPSYVGAGAELFAACTQLGLEGLVAKTLNGRYYPGERRDVWVKAKCADWLGQHAKYRHR